MRKLRTFLLTGALCWPALGLAQGVLPPPPTPLETPILPSQSGDKPTTPPSLGLPATTTLPPVAVPSLPAPSTPLPSSLPTNLPPPLPSTSTSTLPPPSPTTMPPLPPSTPPRHVLADADKPGPMPMPMPSKPDLGMKPLKPMTPHTDRRIPDVTGMPAMDCCPPTQTSFMPPITAAPLIPPPCCPPELPPACEPCGGCYLVGEVLFFRPRRGDMLAEYRANGGVGTTFTEGIYWTPNTEVGYRGGVGFRTADGLAAWAKFTWFEQDLYRQHVVLDPTAPPGSVISTTIFGTLPNNTIAAASGEGLEFTHLFRYQTLDLMAGASFCPSACVDLVLAGGARLARIDQHYGFAFYSAGQLALTAHTSMDIEGAGPRFGGETRVYLCRDHGCCSVALYTRCYANILYVRRQEDQVIRDYNINGAVTDRAFRTLHREDFMPVLELASGLEVEICNCLKIAGGYEWNHYWDLGTLTDRFGNPARQDITLEGVFVQLGLFF